MTIQLREKVDKLKFKCTGMKNVFERMSSLNLGLGGHSVSDYSTEVSIKYFRSKYGFGHVKTFK